MFDVQSPAAEEFFQSYREIANTFRTLSGDFNDCVRLLTNLPDSQFLRRSLVKSFSALVEGMIYGFKKVALTSNTLRGGFTPAEIACLRERTYRINAKGDAEEDRMQVS